jgi:hypothetical protein
VLILVGGDGIPNGLAIVMGVAGVAIGAGAGVLILVGEDGIPNGLAIVLAVLGVVAGAGGTYETGAYEV